MERALPEGGYSVTMMRENDRAIPPSQELVLLFQPNVEPALVQAYAIRKLRELELLLGRQDLSWSEEFLRSVAADSEKLLTRMTLSASGVSSRPGSSQLNEEIRQDRELRRAQRVLNQDLKRRQGGYQGGIKK